MQQRVDRLNQNNDISMKHPEHQHYLSSDLYSLEKSLKETSLELTATESPDVGSCSSHVASDDDN